MKRTAWPRRRRIGRSDAMPTIQRSIYRHIGGNVAITLRWPHLGLVVHYYWSVDHRLPAIDASLWVEEAGLRFIYSPTNKRPIVLFLYAGNHHAELPPFKAAADG